MSWTATLDVRAIAVDFNSDGMGDLVACGNSELSTLITAFDNGDESFTVIDKHIFGEQSNRIE